MAIQPLSIEDVKKIDHNLYDQQKILGFIKYYGIDKITTKELNEFEKHFSDVGLFADSDFWKFYKRAIENENTNRNEETNRINQQWTIAVGKLTYIATTAAVLSLITSIVALFKH